jgi:hypothetical protein
VDRLGGAAANCAADGERAQLLDGLNHRRVRLRHLESTKPPSTQTAAGGSSSVSSGSSKGAAMSGRNGHAEDPRPPPPPAAAYGVKMPAIRARLRVSAATLTLAGALLVVPAATAAKVFPNCTAVHKVHKHGIAKNARRAKLASGLTGRPFVSAALYAANQSKDRDHDGVACET